MKLIGFGRTSEVLEYDQGKAVKLFYEKFNHIADYEFNIAKEVSRIYEECPVCYETVEIDGRKGIVYELITGVILNDVFLQNPLQILNLLRIMGDTHSRMNTIRTERLTNSKELFVKKINRSSHISEKEKAIIMEFLSGTDDTCLCHGDFHPENLIVTAKRKFKVIDWTNAYSGTGLSDAARTYYLLKYGKSPAKKPIPVILLEVLLRPLFARTYLNAYFKNRIPMKAFKRWFLIICIMRIEENISEEKKGLLRKIRKTDIEKLFMK